MSSSVRLLGGLTLFLLSLLGPSSPLPAAGTEALPSLPAPRRLPAGPPSAAPPVEEPAPAPRELTGPASPMPAELPREEPAPMPRAQTPTPPPLLLPSLARSAPLAEVQRLQQEIERLRMEREAMLLEETELMTAREIKVGKAEETAQFRQRITDLLMRAARQEKANRLSERDRVRVPTSDRTGPRPRPEEKTPHSPDGSNAPSTQAPSSPSVPSAPSALPPPRKPATPTTQPSSQPENSPKVLTDAPIDPLSLAQSLFLAGDHAAALKAYHQLDQDEPRPEEHVAMQYMIACCLRKLGKLDEAAMVYREVANSHGNDILIENAQWYLRAMKDRRELETQLDELRQRRQALMPRKP